jgi:protein-S-isoprenylcysteine O-methyltransferase Ste14
VGVWGLLLVNPALPTLLAVVYAHIDFTLATRREEKLLKEALSGYADYMTRTPRFLPRWPG